jgi:hypothetical protein
LHQTKLRNKDVSLPRFRQNEPGNTNQPFFLISDHLKVNVYLFIYYTKKIKKRGKVVDIFVFYSFSFLLRSSFVVSLKSTPLSCCIQKDEIKGDCLSIMIKKN